MASAPPRFLHVANGSSTTMTIEAAGMPGARSIWADPLYEGPVPGGITDSELIEVRTQFLSGGEAAADPGNDPREWRAVMARHDAYDELVLWYEHDLFCQLNLIQLLTWIREHVPPAKPVSLVCIGSFPGRPDFKGLGELTAGELAPLLDTRQPITAAQYELAGRAWQAFRSSSPGDLDALRQGDTSALPYLAAALTRFLQEYPWTSDGLSRTERRLLELASDGIALGQAFPRMHEGEQAYYVTDRSLLALADTLAGSSPALLTLTRPADANGSAFRAVATITDAGRSVLAGQLDKLAACGVNRWLGGVHLHSAGTMWRWDDARQAVVHVGPEQA